MVVAICVAAGAALLFLLYLLAVKPSGRGNAVCERYIKGMYAHRGLYDIGLGIPENSLAAYDRAASNGFGMELDVRLTGDGKLVMLHDNNAKRMTGEDVIISEISADEACALGLRGTGQRIPTFEQMLETVGGRVPLLIELKVVKNREKDTCRELCEKVCRALEGYEGPYMLESFDPRVIYWLRRHSPQTARGQLVTFYRRHGEKCPLALDFLLRNAMFNIFTRPDFIAMHYEDRDCFMMRLNRRLFHVKEFQWTVDSPEKQGICQAEGAVPIFERYMPAEGNIYVSDSGNIYVSDSSHIEY